MRALQVQTLGGPDAVGVREVPAPEPADGLVLVDVRACGVSFVDLLLTRGEYQLARPAVHARDPVGGHGPRWPWVAGVSFGAFAERVAVPGFALMELPDDVSFEEGAVVGVNYQSAHFASTPRARRRRRHGRGARGRRGCRERGGAGREGARRGRDRGWLRRARVLNRAPGGRRSRNRRRRRLG